MMNTRRVGVCRIGPLFAALLALSCDRGTPLTAHSPLSPSVAREMDAVQAATRAVHDEYERLYSTTIFPDSSKAAAARWYKTKEYEWQVVQLIDQRERREGLSTSTLDALVFLDNGNTYIESEPSIFVETRYYPRYQKHELASLAKLASLRDEYDAARLRLVKVLLEGDSTSQPRGTG